ncbi:MAG: hypothetical protein QOE09_2860 [Ilumatobacteraceae bacterium]|jgi:hypothetical protein
MARQLVTAFETALSQCAAADVGVLSPPEVAALVVDLRRVATRLEAEIARVVHAAGQAEVWRGSGATSMEAWLANETRVSIRSARDQVRLAGTLAVAPLVAEKMAEGVLSVDNVRLLGAVVAEKGFDSDAEVLVEIASGAPGDTRRALERWLAMVDSAGEPEREQRLRLKRHLTFTANGEGMFDVKGLLMPEDVAHVRAALDHIAGAAYADETGRAHHTRIADAFVEVCTAYNAGSVTGGRERPKVLITVPFETVVERGAERGVIIDVNATVSGEAVRRLCCDAELNRVVTRGRSTILDFGTTTRFASDSQYYAMVARDGGCRWPGCDRPPGWCQAHHIDEVVRDDGPTDLNMLALFCSTHHHLVHQPGWELVGDADDLSIRRPDGTMLAAPCTGPAITSPAKQLQLATV